VKIQTAGKIKLGLAFGKGKGEVIIDAPLTIPEKEFIANKDVEWAITLDSSKNKARTLSQNALLWQKLTEIGDIVGCSKEMAYKTMCMMYGKWDIVEIHNCDALKTFIDNWNDRMGLGWIAVQESETEALVVYGTSVYTAEELAKFTDHVMDEWRDLL
jgi:hypothetical protein